MGDMLSQEEINALLGGNNSQVESETLTQEESDIILEVGIETMTVSSKVLENLLNTEVTISSPTHKIVSAEAIKEYFENEDCAAVRIDYKVGIEGSNVLILKERDALIISGLMTGGNGVDDLPTELNDLYASALGEAMNQMVGSSSTILAKILDTKVDIDTPKIIKVTASEKSFQKIGIEPDSDVIMNEFNLKISNLVDSKIIQLMPVSFAKKLTDTITQNGFSFSNGKNIVGQNNAQNNQATSQPSPQPMQQQTTSMGNMGNMGNMGSMGSMGNMGMNQMGQMNNMHNGNVNARPAEFQELIFAELEQQKENIGIIMDVPLEVTVEMGRTSRKIKDILEFSPGTIIELDKLAGDPIDILVNGKYVAKGEVVVIDENYGIRITEIVNVNYRV